MPRSMPSMSGTDHEVPEAGALSTAERAAVLVPIKSFDQAKGRLASRLDEGRRRRLAHVLAQGVVRAAAPTPCYVVCDDDEVAREATLWGARVVWSPTEGLNASVTAATERLRSAGHDHVVVAHGDLAFAPALAPGAFDHLIVPGEIRLVTDAAGDGTNVASVPLDLAWRFGYGAGSCDRHVDEARRLGRHVEVVRDDPLGRDLDTENDLDAVLETLATDTRLAARCPDLIRVLNAPD